MPLDQLPRHSPGLADPGDRDLVGDWYHARLACGIDDPMWLGFFTGNDDLPEWETAPHRAYDGIGALALLLPRRGWEVGPLLTSREQAPPGLARRLRAPRAGLPAAAGAPRWRALDPGRAKEPNRLPPAACLLDRDDSERIEAAARAAGTGTPQWLLWTADRATRYLLAEPDACLPWLYPVNLRGAVRQARPTMNHCSGLNLCLEDHATPADVREQVRRRLAALEHWRTWRLLTLGRWLGRGGVALLYRLAQAAPGSSAGSWSDLGEGPSAELVPRGPGARQLQGLLAVAPGSPGWPVSVATLRWQGRRALGCRLHPVLQSRPQLADAFVEHWHRLATGLP